MQKRAKRIKTLLGLIMAGFFAVVIFNLIASHRTPAADKLDYPVAKKVEQVDTYHDVKVKDPYRWMEEMNSEATKVWVDAEEKMFDEFVGDSPIHGQVRRRILEIREVDTYGAPFRRGERYFFSKTPAGKSQSIVYMQETLEAKPEVLLDPDVIVKDPAHRYAGFSASPNGQRLVYWIGKGQTAWRNAYIMDVDSGRSYAEVLTGILGGVSWTRDAEGFFYVRYEVPEEGKELQDALHDPRVYFHKVRTAQTDDEFIFALPEHPTWLLGTNVTYDGAYLIINVGKGSSFSSVVDQIYYKDLRGPEAAVTPLFTMDDVKFSYEGNSGETFFLQTTLDAPKKRLVAININEPSPEHWRELIPEAEESLLTVSVIGDYFVLMYNRDAQRVVKVFTMDGTFKYEVDFPTIALVGGFGDDPDSRFAFYQLWGLTETGTTYRLDLDTGKSELFRRPDVRFDPDDFVIKQVFYNSKDGARVPMFIAHKRGTKPDSDTPLFMYAYGAAAWSAMPWYQPHILVWLEMGGIYALPNIRGGGEYGEDWYQQGILDKKQNGIDDYVAAAEWLIENGYTSAKKLIANGGSASGVLAGAAVIQRPDLFGAGVIEHPRLDMLRYHLFTGATARVSELGSSDDAEQFRTLFAYSPYHNLKSGTCYPATLVLVGEKDEITPPLHGYKFMAALQAIQECERPALLKVVRGAGHSYGLSNEQNADTWADVWSFVVKTLELDISTL